MQVCWFSDGSEHEQAQSDAPRLIRLQDLRSAFLLRERITTYRGRSAAAQQAELRRHFDAVLALLEVNTSSAIETALDRLEASQGKVWSHIERERHRAELLANRKLQLARLRVYRDRGLFPQNEGHADHAVPIFVDNHDTACAVGHLMRLSDWEEEVVEIQETNNLVYVPDVSDSAVAEWALTAGVTLEEAALIQPGYPYETDQLLSDYSGPNNVLISNGLKYSNFQLQVQNYEFGTNLPANVCDAVPWLDGCQPGTGPPVATDEGPKPEFDDIGFLVGEGPFDSEFGGGEQDFIPNGSNWIIIGGEGPTGWNLIEGRAPALHTAQRLLFRFDVSPVQAGATIDRIGHASKYWTYGLSVPSNPNERADFSMETRSIVGDAVLASTVATYDPDAPRAYAPEFASAVGFAPQNAITVETEIWLQYGATVGSLRVDLNLLAVPEPATLWLAAFSIMTGIFTSGRRART